MAGAIEAFACDEKALHEPQPAAARIRDVLQGGKDDELKLSSD
jgi:hypothetical protein